MAPDVKGLVDGSKSAQQAGLRELSSSSRVLSPPGIATFAQSQVRDDEASRCSRSKCPVAF
jgi:hypothetical protein